MYLSQIPLSQVTIKEPTFEEWLDFAASTPHAGKRKCTKSTAFPCGNTCLPSHARSGKPTNCKKKLEGQAKSHAGWLKLQAADHVASTKKQGDERESRAKKQSKTSILAKPDTSDISEWKQYHKETIENYSKTSFEATKAIVQREKSNREGVGVLLSRKNSAGEKITEGAWNATKNAILGDRAIVSGIADKHPNMRSDNSNYMGNETKKAIRYAESNDLDTLVSHTSWNDRRRQGYDEALEDAKKRKDRSA